MLDNLTVEQMRRALEEVDTLACWRTIKAWAEQVYGPGKAAKVEVEVEGEYNDEGGTNYSIDTITAYDSAGNTLSYDLSQPFFTTFFAEQIANLREEYHLDEDEQIDDGDIHMLLRECYLSREEQALWKPEWVKWDALPYREGERTYYDLTQEPALTYEVSIQPRA